MVVVLLALSPSFVAVAVFAAAVGGLQARNAAPLLQTLQGLPSGPITMPGGKGPILLGRRTHVGKNKKAWLCNSALTVTTMSGFSWTGCELVVCSLFLLLTPV